MGTRVSCSRLRPDLTYLRAPLPLRPPDSGGLGVLPAVLSLGFSTFMTVCAIANNQSVNQSIPDYKYACHWFVSLEHPDTVPQ